MRVTLCLAREGCEFAEYAPIRRRMPGMLSANYYSMVRRIRGCTTAIFGESTDRTSDIKFRPSVVSKYKDSERASKRSVRKRLGSLSLSLSLSLYSLRLRVVSYARRLFARPE